ncbi:MAG: IclR family transcriptional regulator [Deltaproteobacteria bacterium]|nr:IclR family transcriptional regulator [Deltaproteobacteria bacterium]
MTFIKSIEKAVDVLSCFTLENPLLRVVEISHLTGLNQSTVSRILSTLAKKQCIEQIVPSGKYRLGIKFHQWSAVLRHKTNLPDLARPVMEKLRDSCGEEVTLYGLDENRRICLEAVKSHFDLAKVTPVGKILPLHCGAAGKVLLAYLTPSERKKFISSKGLEKFTPETIVNPEELEMHLEKIRQDGYAVSQGEREKGAYSIVAPIFNQNKKIAASLSVSGPIFRLSETALKKNIEAVQHAANEISVLLSKSNLNHRQNS